ncbi:MAG: outer membrane protein transport protein [Bdellovibrionales bacterium]|nr:outer membrane protein transport protein [Bdellovibrionales bacterium]
MVFRILALHIVLAGSAWAGPLEDTFGGCARPVLQDTLGSQGLWDPFSAAGNPAWAEHKSAFAVGTGALNPDLGTKSNDAASSVLLFVDGQRVFHRHVWGMMLSLPIGRGSLVDTGEGLNRQPFLTARARNFSLQPYYSYHMEDSAWSFGIASPVVFDVDSYSEVHTHNDASYARLRAGLSPSFSYVLGLSYQGIPDTLLSLSYHERQRSKAEGALAAELPFVNTNGIELQTLGEASYGFSPRRLAVQASHRWNDQWTTGLMVRFSNWSEMSTPFLRIVDSSFDFKTEVSQFKTKNTWEVGVGSAYRFSDDISLMGAYRFQQTPLTADVGFYDRDQHVFALGVGWTIPFTLDHCYLTTRLHRLAGGGLYSWVGIGLGSDL